MHILYYRVIPIIDYMAFSIFGVLTWTLDSHIHKSAFAEMEIRNLFVPPTKVI